MIDVLCRHVYNSSDHQLVKRNNLFNRDIVLDVHHLADYNFLFKKKVYFSNRCSLFNLSTHGKTQQ